jgi:hypothetical protein
MTDTGLVNSIRSMLDGVTAYDDLKTVARDVQRRGLRLDAQRLRCSPKGKRFLGSGKADARRVLWSGWRQSSRKA